MAGKILPSEPTAYLPTECLACIGSKGALFLLQYRSKAEQHLSMSDMRNTERPVQTRLMFTHTVLGIRFRYKTYRRILSTYMLKSSQ